uniref:Uncharacterized protein n=1 Tax=Peromyscus maniculatus bairdii TaxID=230844 RepID=A0A8C8UMD5_PERMB
LTNQKTNKQQVIMCMAAVTWEAGKPLSIEEIEVPPPKAHQVRIETISNAICHTDASVPSRWHGRKYPIWNLSTFS